MLDFSPAGHPAARVKQFAAHGLIQAWAIVRHPEQLAVIWLFPLLTLIGSRYFGATMGLNLASLAPSVAALAVFATGFTAIALTAHQSTCDRLVATPLGRVGLSLGTLLALCLILASQLALVVPIAYWLGWQPTIDVWHLQAAGVAGILALATFAAWGLLVSLLELRLRIMVTITVFIAGAWLGGLLFPSNVYPDWLQSLLRFLPTGALGETLRLGSWSGVLVLAAWCWLSLLLARRFHRWLI